MSCRIFLVSCIMKNALQIVLIVLLGVHAIIHLLGFLKAYELLEFKEIAQPISKGIGFFWILASILFTLTAIAIIFRFNLWWGLGLIATIVSQILILSHWSDAKFGTIINVVVLVVSLLGCANYSFRYKVNQERESLLTNVKFLDQRIVNKEHILTLPSIVQKWLIHSGIIGRETISSAYLIQELQLKLKPRQTSWNKGRAQQYISVEPPAFNWTTNIELNGLLNVVGRDKYKEGKGEMFIKLLSLIPIADVKNNEKIDEATLQRYLAEIVWIPSAALSSYIKWKKIDENSARATMEYKGIRGSGVFHFDDNGQFTKFVALRYKDVKDNEPIKWTVRATKTEDIRGVKIPTECEASWNLDGTEWKWLKLRITQIEYNLTTIPEVEKR